MYRLMQLLVNRVTLFVQDGEARLEIDWHEVGWLELVREHSARSFMDEKMESLETEVAL